MTRRVIVLDDADISRLLSGDEIEISFEKPMTKITLVNEDGFETLANTEGKCMKLVSLSLNQEG